MKKILFLSGLMITVISFGICFAEAPTSEMLSSMSDEELKALSTQLASSSSIYSFFHFVGDLFGAIFVFGALLLIPAWFFGKGKLIATLTAISFCMGLLFGLGNSLTMPEGLPEVNAEIEQRKKNISAEATKQQQKEKAENTQNPEQSQMESTTPKKDNSPYYEYHNGDKGLIGYMYWYSYVKTPEIEHFPVLRKTIPHNGLISEEELQKMEWRKIAFKKNLMYPDRYEMTDNGNMLYNGHTSLEIPGISKISGELVPAGSGIIAKRLPDGLIAPVYIGMIDGGQYSVYGIEFDTVKVDGKYLTYLKYEGQFKNHKYDGEGNLYEINTKKMNNGIPEIKVSSGNFKEGKKEGEFITYYGGNMVREKYQEGRKI